MAPRRIRVVIQSRLSSSRLPGKALMTMAGMPLIELVARRAARNGHEVVVATSVEPYDDRVAQHLESVGIRVIRGSLDDVLGRFVQATEGLDPDDRVVRLTGDNPITDADLVDELLAAMDESGNTYGRIDIEQCPEGLGAEGFLAKDLRRAAEHAVADYDREHVTPWLRRELGELLFVPKANPGHPVAYRCTTDCLNDYYRISRLFDDEPDPVGVRWDHLVNKLKHEVDEAGPMVPVRTGRSPRLTSLVLGTRNVGVLGAGSSRDGTTVRDVFVSAVNRGVSHAFAEAGTAEVVRAGTIPALQQRLGTHLRLPRAVGGLSGEAVKYQVRTAVETGFAFLGQRRLAGAVFGSVRNALDGEGAGWAALGAYRDAGTVGKIGVALARPAELADLWKLPDVDIVVIDSQPDTEIEEFEALTQMAAVKVVSVPRARDHDRTQAWLSQWWIDAVVVNPVTAADLDADIRLAAAIRG